MAKTVEEIIAEIIHSIAHIYREPEKVVSTLGELDVALYQLHHLLARATDQLEQFIQARVEEVTSDLDGYLERTSYWNRHQELDDPDDFAPVIARWREFDELLGLKIH